MGRNNNRRNSRRNRGAVIPASGMMRFADVNQAGLLEYMIFVPSITGASPWVVTAATLGLDTVRSIRIIRATFEFLAQTTAISNAQLAIKNPDTGENIALGQPGMSYTTARTVSVTNPRVSDYYVYSGSSQAINIYYHSTDYPAGVLRVFVAIQIPTLV